MSPAAAIRDRDVAELPSRRDEDWRWTDLRGLVRSLPARSQTYVGNLGPGVFDALSRRSPREAGHRSRCRVKSGGTDSAVCPAPDAENTQRTGIGDGLEVDQRP